MNQEASAIVEELLQKERSLSALKNVEQQANPGSFIFSDEANLFKGEPSAELMDVVGRLNARGINVAIFTSDNPDNLETAALRDQLTQANGLGSYSDGTLQVNTLACVWNNKTTDGRKELDCVTGAGIGRYIGDSQVNSLVNHVVDEGYYADDFSAGFANGLNEVDQILAAREAQATQQAAQPTATPYAETDTTPIEIQPSESRPNFMETHGREVYGGVTAVILMALVGADQMFAKPKRLFVKGIESDRRLALNEATKLNLDFGKGLSLFDAIISEYGESYPEKANQAREDRSIFSNKVDEVKAAAEELKLAKVGFFRKKEDMEDVRAAAKKLRTKAMELLRLIDDQSNKAEDLQERKNSARTNAAAAKEKLAEVKDVWYVEKFKVFGEILPPKDKAMVGIESLAKEAFDNAYYNTALALKGNDQAVEVLGLLEKFMLAVGALTSGYEIADGLYRDAGSDIAKWPNKAIDLKQLANSGIQLLTTAKAGISITEKLDEVIRLSKAAEVEFANAKDFSSATATILKQQDENDAAIAEIEEKGFEDKHIKKFRDAMVEALSKANVFASQGNWKEAHAQLGVLRVKTNESLIEMKRLEQLQKQNIIDLEILAKEVEKDKKRYAGETTKAWTDLSENFVPANYDEKDKIWKELREGSESGEKIVIADLNPYFTAIALTLKELTDDKSDENDIASKASSRNSFEEQKFDESAALIRKMEKRLAESRQMMDALLERQKLANKSKSEYSAAIVNSSARLRAAEESIDTKEENRLVDKEVDEQIKNARKFIDLAERAGKASIYVAALEAANRATDLAIRARQSAEAQIKALKELYSKLESHKKSSNAAANKAIQAVIDESDEVITSATTNIQNALQRSLAALVTAESALAAKEDHVLSKAIEDLLGDLDQVDEKTEELEQAFKSDRNSYQDLLDDLKRAISDADSAISRASSKCNDSDAGSAGDGALGSARSSNPDMASWGESRSSIKSKIQAAKRAEDYADSAYSQASSAILAAEQARQRELERQREAQRARERAAEQAREASRTVNSVGGHASRKI